MASRINFRSITLITRSLFSKVPWEEALFIAVDSSDSRSVLVIIDAKMVVTNWDNSENDTQVQ